LIQNYYNSLEQQTTPSALNTVEQFLLDFKTQIEEKIKDLSSKFEHLLTNQSTISMEKDTVTQSLQASSASSGAILNTTAMSITDESADHE